MFELELPSMSIDHVSEPATSSHKPQPTKPGKKQDQITDDPHSLMLELKLPSISIDHVSEPAPSTSFQGLRPACAGSTSAPLLGRPLAGTGSKRSASMPSHKHQQEDNKEDH